MKTLKKGIEEYLKNRCNVGFKMQSARKLLLEFALFLKENGATSITVKLALDFATRNPETSRERWAVRLRAIRQFAKYWSTEDLRTEVPPKNALPYSYRRKAPYIYTDDEIKRLIECSESGQPHNRFNQHTYFVLFGLLAVTGMRIREVLNLECNEINFKDRIITITKSKFRKTRYIPIHNSTIEVLKNYSNCRNQHFPNHKIPQFFIDHNGNALKGARVGYIFRKRKIKIGMISQKDRRSQRISDFRHTFAVKTLINWYKKGVNNIDSYIPLLSTYLGHVKPSNTYWYLTAIPELLNIVAARCKSNKRRSSS